MEAKKLIDNLENGIYEDALIYLTGDGEDQRGLKPKTLKNFNVGLGSEKFNDEEGVYQNYDSIYFPIYMPRSMKNKNDSRIDNCKTLKGMKKMIGRASVEQ